MASAGHMYKPLARGLVQALGSSYEHTGGEVPSVTPSGPAGLPCQHQWLLVFLVQVSLETRLEY